VQLTEPFVTATCALTLPKLPPDTVIELQTDFAVAADVTEQTATTARTVPTRMALPIPAPYPMRNGKV
jgi:hypothetical protein